MSQGDLFSQAALSDTLPRSAAWRALDTEALAIRRDWIGGLLALADRPDAIAPADLVHAILAAIGWGHRVLASPGDEPQDCPYTPDALLFLEAEHLVAARAETGSRARLRHAACLLVTPPPNADPDSPLPDGPAPAVRLHAHLDAAAASGANRLCWGLLSDGRHWRLYRQGAGHRGFLGMDLTAALAAPPDDPLLRIFVLCFGRDAFVPGKDARSLLDALLADDIP